MGKAAGQKKQNQQKKNVLRLVNSEVIRLHVKLVRLYGDARAIHGRLNSAIHGSGHPI